MTSAFDRGASGDNISTHHSRTGSGGSVRSRKDSKGQLLSSHREGKGHSSSNVQEELKRLIDPDVSFSDDTRVSELVNKFS